MKNCKLLIIKETAANIGFARCGVEGKLRKFVSSTRKKPFHFFCKFEKMKMVFARDWFSS